MLITFLRHSQSDGNIRWCQPIRDSNLTPVGIQQSENLKGHYNVVYCSPLRRARDTLSKSNITYDELIIAPEVRECVYSIDDILIDEEVSDDFIETDEDILERCRKLLRILIAKNKDNNKKILVLSHFGFISEFTSLYCSHRVGLDVATTVEEEVKTLQDRRSEKKSIRRTDIKLPSGSSSSLHESKFSNPYLECKSALITDTTKSPAPESAVSFKAPRKSVRKITTAPDDKTDMKAKTRGLSMTHLNEN